MQPIVSACGTATYQLAKFLTKILQKYTGITHLFVKDSKGFSQYLRLVHIEQDEELVSFDVSALFTCIFVPIALDVINRLFTEHIEVPEAKEAIHIRRFDPNLNRNIGKMSIPHCFDLILGIKPKHLRVNLLSQVQESVDEVALLSQIPGLNLTQFYEIGYFRSNVLSKIPKHSNRACRAKYLLN